LQTPSRGRTAYYLLFGVSGFSGLIYESVWSHYLKLFLGHAAYAQTLVLMIFMGGMAAGSWVAARRSAMWSNLLAAYALVEGAVGVFALFFHRLFDSLVNWAYVEVIPDLGSVLAVQAFKWGLAGLLILPQSVLLGMTFPLMTAGVIRRYPDKPGASIAALYFTNSLGGAVGVLASGFVLIPAVGLPGTVLTAGLLNLLLALTVWLTASGRSVGPPVWPDTRGPRLALTWPAVLLLGAFVTGASSFMYEIGWIRMLSMVLGSSTHAFELMLSAFILGLALGGRWIQKRIEDLASPVRYLAYVQFFMGGLAILTLPVYGNTFELMHLALAALDRTEPGYVAFNIFSHLISVLVMVPATFCAGMTLPLMTYALLRRGLGERAVGAVYAANTVGAIVGVLVSVHVVMPLIGLKALIGIGAGLDIVLGVALLGALTAFRTRWELPAAATVSVGVLALVLSLVDMDPYRMASGVYRTGVPALPRSDRILYYRDGKTATITLRRSPQGLVVVSTNGKPDAAVNLGKGPPASDEVTMVMAAALPLALFPQAKTAANIGMGSGLTTEVLLRSARPTRVDTVEIEAAMVEAAHGFRPMVTRPFTDPRSHIYLEDAKTFFSTRRQQYDVIVSEPSNPWVSGISGLFSEEFYHLVRDYLTPGGLLVQWLQIYKTDLPLVASVLRALGPSFQDYALYNTDNSNLLVVARKGDRIGALDPGIFSEKPLAQAMARVGLRTPQDLEARKLGSKQLLEGLFDSYGAPANSDYFPFVDLNAPRSRFLGTDALSLVSLGYAPLPIVEMLGGREPLRGALTPDRYFTRSLLAEKAAAMRDLMVGREAESEKISVPGSSARDAVLTKMLLHDYDFPRSEPIWLSSLFRVILALDPYLPPAELKPLWNGIITSPCFATLSPRAQGWARLGRAVAARDPAAMAQEAHGLLAAADDHEDTERLGYLVASAMLGDLAGGQRQAARQVWDHYSAELLQGNGQPNIILQLLYVKAHRGE
jgi:spermidine synthase